MSKRAQQFGIFGLALAWVLLMLLSLRTGFLNICAYSPSHASTQGIDFFSLPKCFLNLLESRSMYDSWAGAPYGPYSTWYVSHPAFGVVAGFWLSFFKPWTAYGAFTLVSIALLAWSGRLLARLTADPVEKSLCYLLLLCSFPVYWILHSGNIHAVSVFGLTLVVTALFACACRSGGPVEKSAPLYLLCGLLVLLFSKPLALLYVPVLLLNRATRRPTLLGLLLYLAVSAAFLHIPLLNPERIGAEKILQLALDPQFVRENLNIYKNNFALNPYMKDNSIHWFHMIAQSDFYWNHVDIFSLATFANTLAGRILPGAIYKLPLAAGLLLSVCLALVRDPGKRLELSLLMVLALSLTFFLSYTTVWEYQYALFQPAVVILLLLRKRGGGFFQGKWAAIALGLCVFFYLPSPYVLLRERELDDAMLTAIRAGRVVPALGVYVILTGMCAAALVRQIRRAADPGYRAH